jgi:hypothetical protein
MIPLTPDDLERFFPKADAAAIEEFFRALHDFEEDGADDNFNALLDVIIQLNGTGSR